MKRFSAAILACVLLLSLSACKPETSAPSGTPSEAVIPSPAPAETSSPSSGDSASAPPMEENTSNASVDNPAIYPEYGTLLEEELLEGYGAIQIYYRETDQTTTLLCNGQSVALNTPEQWAARGPSPDWAFSPITLSISYSALGEHPIPDYVEVGFVHDRTYCEYVSVQVVELNADGTPEPVVYEYPHSINGISPEDILHGRLELKKRNEYTDPPDESGTTYVWTEVEVSDGGNTSFTTLTLQDWQALTFEGTGYYEYGEEWKLTYELQFGGESAYPMIFASIVVLYQNGEFYYRTDQNGQVIIYLNELSD